MPFEIHNLNSLNIGRANKVDVFESVYFVFHTLSVLIFFFFKFRVNICIGKSQFQTARENG